MRVLAVSITVGLLGAVTACGGSGTSLSSSGASSTGDSSSGAETSGASPSAGGSAGGSTAGAGTSGATSPGASASGASPGGSSGSPASGSPTLVGTWLAVDGPTSVELVLSSDGTYQVTVLVLTSTVTGDELVEKGNFVVSGATITFTPTSLTCPGALTPSTDLYVFNGGGLVTTAPGGTSTTYLRTTAPPIGTGLTLVVGCGSPWMPEPVNGSDPSPGAPVAEPSIFGNWLNTNNAGNVQAEWTLNANGTYQATILIKTSTVTGDELIQTGTFVLDGGNITFTPAEESCSGPVPIAADTYAFNGAGIDINGSGTTTTFLATTTTPAQLGAGLTLVIGCGSPWMPVPVAPVSN